MSNLFDPFGYSASELSNLAIIMLGSGLVGAISLGAFIDRTGLYKRTLNVVTFIMVFMTVLLNITLSGTLDK